MTSLREDSRSWALADPAQGGWTQATLGEVTREESRRAGGTETGVRVYGVSRQFGLTPEAKYASADLTRYKAIQPGWFAYNPMRLNIGSIGFCRVDDEPGLVSPDYVVFSCREDMLAPQYLAQYIRSPAWRSQTEGIGVGSVRVRIYYRELAGMPLRLPPIEEQRRIAGILDALDDKIDLNRRMNETLDATARALFQSWFIDFDPVRAKADGRSPAVRADVAALFPAALSDSEVGDVPQGWSIRSIGDLADVVGGSTPSTTVPAFWDGGHHCWATPKDLSRLSTPVLLDTERRVTDIGLSQIGSGLLAPGTVLLSSRAPIGYLAIAEVPVAVNQGFIAMRPKPGVPSQFLLHWARSAMTEIVSRANGSTFLEISKANFRPIPVATPPPPLLRAFDAAVGRLYSHVVSNERQTLTLTNLRDAMLPMLTAGDLRLSDAERAIDRAYV